jgi:DMSO reductase family type II enzyme chaperone
VTAVAAAETVVAGTLRRAGMYRLLAGAFAYPTAPSLSDVARRAGEAAAAAAGGLGSTLGRLADAAREGDAVTLAGEHLDLFERAVRCPSYEGAWGPQQMSGKAALLADVAGFYAAFGVTPAPQHADIEDHVGAELEFMSVLALKEAYALAEGRAEAAAIVRAAQATFLRDHLGRWGEAFAARLESTATPGFYPAAGAALAAWIGQDCAALGVTPARVETAASAEAAPFTCPMAAPEAPAPTAQD